MAYFNDPDLNNPTGSIATEIVYKNSEGVLYLDECQVSHDHLPLVLSRVHLANISLERQTRTGSESISKANHYRLSCESSQFC